MNENKLYHTAPDYETKAKLHLGVAGKIVCWDDERGFGLVATTEPKAEIFFHAKSLHAREIAPKVGEKVQVRAQYQQEKRRWTATEITSPQREQAVRARTIAENALFRPMIVQLKWAVPVVVLWFGVLAVLAWQLAAIFALVSGVAMALYAWDKHCAIHDKNRVPEMSLHAVALLGGWAGALVARYLFRHKTQKQPFVSLFWGTVVLNMALVGYWIFSGSLKDLI